MASAGDHGSAKRHGESIDSLEAHSSSAGGAAAAAPHSLLYRLLGVLLKEDPLLFSPFPAFPARRSLALPEVFTLRGCISGGKRITRCSSACPAAGQAQQRPQPCCPTQPERHCNEGATSNATQGQQQPNRSESESSGL